MDTHSSLLQRLLDFSSNLEAMAVLTQVRILGSGTQGLTTPMVFSSRTNRIKFCDKKRSSNNSKTQKTNKQKKPKKLKTKKNLLLST
jgi:hypothetical protein